MLGKNWRFASASHCCHVQLLVVSCDAQDCTRPGWPLNLKWITFCWSRPGKCLPLDEGSACVRNGGILHNDYFDFIYDRLATREKKKHRWWITLAGVSWWLKSIWNSSFPGSSGVSSSADVTHVITVAAQQGNSISQISEKFCYQQKILIQYICRPCK